MVKGIELNIHVGSISTTLLDLIPKGPSQEEFCLGEGGTGSFSHKVNGNQVYLVNST